MSCNSSTTDLVITVAIDHQGLSLSWGLFLGFTMSLFIFVVYWIVSTAILARKSKSKARKLRPLSLSATHRTQVRSPTLFDTVIAFLSRYASRLLSGVLHAVEKVQSVARLRGLSAPKSSGLRPLTLPARHCQPVSSGIVANIVVIYARVMQFSVTRTEAARVLVLDGTFHTQHLASDCSRIVLGYFDGWVKTWGDASRSVVASFSSRMLQLQSIIMQILEGSPLVIVWRGALSNPLVLASVPSSLFATLTFSFAQAMQLAVTQARSARVLVLNSTASIEHLAREWSSTMLGHTNEWIEAWGEPSLALITFLASGPVQLLTGDVRALETLPMWINAIVHFWRTVSFPKLNIPFMTEPTPWVPDSIPTIIVTPPRLPHIVKSYPVDEEVDQTQLSHLGFISRAQMLAWFEEIAQMSPMGVEAAAEEEPQAVSEDDVTEQQPIPSTQSLTQRLCDLGTCILTIFTGLFVSVIQLATTVFRGPSLVCILAAAWAAKVCGGYYHLWVKAWGNAPAALSTLRSSSLNECFPLYTCSSTASATDAMADSEPELDGTSAFSGFMRPSLACFNLASLASESDADDQSSDGSLASPLLTRPSSPESVTTVGEDVVVEAKPKVLDHAPISVPLSDVELPRRSPVPVLFTPPSTPGSLPPILEEEETEAGVQQVSNNHTSSPTPEPEEQFTCRFFRMSSWLEEEEDGDDDDDDDQASEGSDQDASPAPMPDHGSCQSPDMPALPTPPDTPGSVPVIQEVQRYQVPDRVLSWVPVSDFESPRAPPTVPSISTVPSSTPAASTIIIREEDRALPQRAQHVTISVVKPVSGKRPSRRSLAPNSLSPPPTPVCLNIIQEEDEDESEGASEGDDQGPWTPDAIPVLALISPTGEEIANSCTDDDAVNWIPWRPLGSSSQNQVDEVTQVAGSAVEGSVSVVDETRGEGQHVSGSQQGPEAAVSEETIRSASVLFGSPQSSSDTEFSSVIDFDSHPPSYWSDDTVLSITPSSPFMARSAQIVADLGHHVADVHWLCGFDLESQTPVVSRGVKAIVGDAIRAIGRAFRSVYAFLTRAAV